MNDEYGVYFLPDRAARAYRSGRNRIWFQVVSLAIAVGLAVVIAYFFPQYSQTWFWGLLGVSLLVSAGQLGFTVVRWLRVRRDTSKVTPGLAIGLNRDGMLLRQYWLPWAEVGQLVVRPGGFGASDSLVATARDQSVIKLPIGYTDTLPATLDAAVRVLSAGRAWVDLSQLD